MNLLLKGGLTTPSRNEMSLYLPWRLVLDEYHINMALQCQPQWHMHSNSTRQEMAGNDFWSKAIANENDKCWYRFQNFRKWSKLTRRLVLESHWLFDIRCQNGFSPKGTLGARRTQMRETRYIQLCWGCLSRREHTHHRSHLRCTQWSGCLCGWHKKCLSPSPNSIKHYVLCGREFGLEHEGKRELIVRALYGGKPAGRRNHLQAMLPRWSRCLDASIV